MKQILQLGDGGVNYDSPAVSLPENVFTDVRNVRFTDAAVETIKGESVFKTLTTVTPDHGISWKRPDGIFDIFLKDGKVVRLNGNTEFTMLDSGSYANSTWQSTYFNGGYAVVFNNGVSTPLYALFGGVDTLAEIPGWNYGTTVTTAKVIRALGYSLVAANLTIVDGVTTTYAPSTIRISVQAATGGFPAVWEPGLTTDTADEFEINSTSPILDMVELKNNMYVYTEDSIHVLSISTGLTRVQPYSKSYGILNIGCVIEVDGKHIAVDNSDIYMHNGSGNIESIGSSRIKKYLFNNINKAYLSKVFMTKNPYYYEVWICYPKGISTKCNEAIVFNYKNNTWTVRDLPNIDYMFNSYNTAITNNTSVMYMVGSTATVLVADSGYSMWDGAALQPFASRVERVNMYAGDALGTIHISSITPILEDSTVSELSVHVVGNNNSNTAADWSNSSGRDITILKPLIATNESYKVDPRNSGRFINYRVSGIGYWRMPIIGLEVAQKDRR
jgi:hypothetical protein